MSNNLEAIELLKTCVERLQEQGFSSYGNTVSELNKAIDLLQADEDTEVQSKCPYCYIPTSVDDETLQKHLAFRHKKPTKETKLRDLLEDSKDWPNTIPTAQTQFQKLISILIEEEY